jgi:hypothetical protein
MPDRSRQLAVLCILTATILATAASVRTSVDLPDTLTVGDQFGLRVELTVPSGADVAPPMSDTGLANVSVLGSTSDRDEGEDSDTLSFSYLLATYTPQPCTIPALEFVVTQDGSPDTLRTEPIPLPLVSVLPSDTVDIKDITQQHRAGRPSLWWLWALLGAIALGLLGYGAHRWFEGRRRPPPAPPPPPPYDEAMEAFRRLEMDNLLQQGQVREYVFRLSEILKRYIERRFEVNAQESTSEEILTWVRQAPLADVQRMCVEWFITTSDPVKFARVLPDDGTLRRMGKEAKAFVHETRPREVELPAAAQSGEHDGGV